MEKRTRNLRLVGRHEVPLWELIHRTIRNTIETAVAEELRAALGADEYERTAGRSGYRNGSRERVLSGPTGPLALTLPRARLAREDGGEEEWCPTVVPRYQRRMREINEAVAGVYLSGGNTRRIRGALRPLLKAAPLSKSSVSRIVTTLRADWETWRTQSLKGVNVMYLYLDAIALKVRSAGKVTSLPVLAAVAVLTDGTKRLVSLEVCGSESGAAWEGFVEGLVARGMKPPRLCIIDGNAGLHSAITTTWPKAKIQRCAVHKLRNILRKAPQHAHDEIREDFHMIVYASGIGAATSAHEAFIRKWSKKCPGAVESLKEAGDELLTFYALPTQQWKTIRTTNVIERLNEEFRRRVKTQGSFPTEESAIVLLYSLVASGQINLRRLDGFDKLVDVVTDNQLEPAA
jgi:transposase-like protein